MYEFVIIDASQEDVSKILKEGVTTLEKLSNLIPKEIYNQLIDFDSLEFNVQSGSEIYKIRKIK